MKMIRKNGKELLLELQNKEGESHVFKLRQYLQGDEAGMISCIRDEYGSTYFKKKFYLPEQIRKESQCGHITFLVAEVMISDKTGTEMAESALWEIAGMLILKEFAPEETMCEIASQIFKKQYRGYGLALPFFQYGMTILKSRRYSAAYCLPVLFHNTTQRLLYRLGLRATGFVLNVFYMERITHSYRRDRNQKHSQGIQIMALGKKDAGSLYLPPEHKEFGKRIYDSLGTTYQIENELEQEPDRRNFFIAGMVKRKEKRFPAVSEIEWKQDMLQSSLEICIHKVGADLSEQIANLHKQYPLTGMQTANIFLNINDKHAVWAYRKLTKAGYFFTGLKPLCSEKEYMVLHNAGEVEIWWEDYVVTREFKELAEYINNNKRLEER